MLIAYVRTQTLYLYVATTDKAVELLSYLPVLKELVNASSYDSISIFRPTIVSPHHLKQASNLAEVVTAALPAMGQSIKSNIWYHCCSVCLC